MIHTLSKSHPLRLACIGLSCDSSLIDAICQTIPIAITRDSTHILCARHRCLGKYISLQGDLAQIGVTDHSPYMVTSRKAQLAVLRAEKAGETTVDISKGSLGHYQLSPTIPKTCSCFDARLFST